METRMGRPKQDVVKDHIVSVRMSLEEHNRLKAYSAKHQKTITEVITEGINILYDVQDKA